MRRITAARLRCPHHIGPLNDSVGDFPLGRATYCVVSLNSGRPSGPIHRGGGYIIRANPFQVWRDGIRPAERLARVNHDTGGIDPVAFRLHVL